MASNNESRQPRRHSVIWPLILITLGALFLLSNLGLLSLGFWGTLWRFWPVILVLVGIELLLGRAHPWLSAGVVIVVLAIVVGLSIAWSGGYVQPIAAEAARVERIVEEAGNLRSAKVEIGFGAGDITVSSLPTDSTSLVEADIAHGSSGSRLDKRFSNSNGEGNLSLKSRSHFWGPWDGNRGDSWVIKLTPNLPLNLRVNTGASRAMIDLTDLNVSDLRIELGASTVELLMPDSGSTKAVVKAGAASVNVTIPPTMAARVRNKGGLSSFEADPARFSKQGSYYVSRDWDTATNRVDLEIESGVASVSVK